MYTRILVPLDGLPFSEAVLSHVQPLAKNEESEIILLRVSVNPVVEFSFSDPSIAEAIIEEIEHETKKYIESLTLKLEAAGLRASFLIREGPVAQTILNVADAMQVDLIAMATHGRSGIQRWALGSVADRVVGHSTVPVMLICPEKAG